MLFWLWCARLLLSHQFRELLTFHHTQVAKVLVEAEADLDPAEEEEEEEVIPVPVDLEEDLDSVVIPVSEVAPEVSEEVLLVEAMAAVPVVMALL